MNKLKNLFLRSRFFIGIILLVQTFTMLVLCISQFGKRKSLAGAFAALGVFCAGVGSLLVVRGAQDEEERIDMIDALCGKYIYINTNENALVKTRRGQDVPTDDAGDESEFDN